MQCNTAYLNHIYDPCARSRKNMRKGAEHNSNQNHKCLCKKSILMSIVVVKFHLHLKLCIRVIHQCKKQKNHVHKPILVLNYLKTFSKIVHLVIYIFYNNLFLIENLKQTHLVCQLFMPSKTRFMTGYYFANCEN